VGGGGIWRNAHLARAGGRSGKGLPGEFRADEPKEPRKKTTTGGGGGEGRSRGVFFLAPKKKRTKKKTKRKRKHIPYEKGLEV